MRILGITDPGQDKEARVIIWFSDEPDNPLILGFGIGGNVAIAAYELPYISEKSISKIVLRIAGVSSQYQVQYLFNPNQYVPNWPNGWQLKKGKKLHISFGTIPIDKVDIPFSENASNYNVYQTEYLNDPLYGMRLVYFGARYYDPEIARWISIDPNSQFCDLYSYAGNDHNPINSIDPDGGLIDEVADAGFILFDLGSLTVNAISGNAFGVVTDLASLGADVGCGFIPGATGGGLAVRVARAAHLAEGLKNIGRLGTYTDMAKLTKGFGGLIQAHHLGEVRILSRLGFSPSKIAKAPAIVLGKKEHNLITKTLLNKLKTGASREDAWKVYQEVYAKHPEALKTLKDFLFSK